MCTRIVREAVEQDFDFIAQIMEDALTPFYGGDHRAHAQRIFDTHIKGGQDKNGQFSREQKMFILEEDGILMGLINIVGKYQGTWKISPLIVDSKFRESLGCGSQLLELAERYISSRGSDKLYCTVAKENKSALIFFRKKGYVQSGEAYDHYKVGSTEIMLYKSPNPVKNRTVLFTRQMIEGDEAAVENFLYDNLLKHFKNVDRKWVRAFFDGYNRRDSGDINKKFKFIYVVINSAGVIVGVAGATPKKGEPIKIMPCVTSNIYAFEKLLCMLPVKLHSYGRKLYIHMVPNVPETILLQRAGWKIENIMPGGYHSDHCTQQWGLLL